MTPPVSAARSGVVSQTVIVAPKTTSVQTSSRLGRPRAAMRSAISVPANRQAVDLGREGAQEQPPADGIMSSAAGTPYAIQRANEISTPASSRR